MRASLVILLVLLLSGCASRVPGDGASDGAGSAPSMDRGPPVGILLADLTSRDCAYNDVIVPVPKALAQSMLPPGFTARHIDSADPEATGAIVTNVIRCSDEAFGWVAADTFVIIVPIELPEQMTAFDAENRTPRAEEDFPIDAYSLAAHTDHEELIRIFEDAGIPRAPGAPMKRALPSAAGSAAQGGVDDASGPVLAYTVTGAPVGALSASHRVWRETPEGLLLLERYITGAGGVDVELAFGPAQCVVRPGTLIAEATLGLPCAFGQDSLNGMEWTGRAYLFPGTDGGSFASSTGAGTAT